jgi:archaellum component FlaC
MVPPLSNQAQQNQSNIHHAETQLDLAELQTHVRIQDEQITAIKGDVNEIKNSVGLLLQRSSEAGKLSFQSVGPLAALGGVVIAFLSMFISNQISPVANEVTGIKEAIASIRSGVNTAHEELEAAKNSIGISVEKDARSEADRVSLHNTVDRLGAGVGNNSATLSSMRSWMERSLTEIETQICSVEQTRNMQVSVVAQLLRPLWEKQGMGPFPYPLEVQPSICNRDNGKMPS